jgi:hypothetical protein
MAVVSDKILSFGLGFWPYLLLNCIAVTARTKCYSIDEGSSVDCTIEDTKLKREEEEGREEE